MKSIAFFVMKTALRDRLVFGVIAGLIAIWGLSFFFGGMALVEQQESGIVLLAGLSRVWIVAGLVLFTAFHVKRVEESKELAWWLARPMPRWHMVVAYWSGLAWLSIWLVAVLTGILALMGALNVVSWGLSLLFECWIVAAIALVFALGFSSGVMASMAALVLYGFSRVLVYMMMTAESPLGDTHIPWFDAVAEWVLSLLFALLPRLDVFAPSLWLVQAQEGALLAQSAMQLAIYVPLVLCMAAIDLSRKEF